jgi:hypothetical protein
MGSPDKGNSKSSIVFETANEGLYNKRKSSIHAIENYIQSGVVKNHRDLL